MSTGLTRRTFFARAAPVIGLGGVLAAPQALLAGRGGAAADEFGTVIAVNGDVVRFLRDSKPTAVSQQARIEPGNAAQFQVGDRIVLSLQEDSVVGIEPFCDVIEGRVDACEAEAVTVAGERSWSMRRL